jgi:putative heme-binding domain-containing protein
MPPHDGQDLAKPESTPACRKHPTLLRRSGAPLVTEADVPTTQNTELLEGGDVTRGRDLVTNHLGANCIACHTVEAKEGSQVGPNLKTIGSKKDRRYILESLLNPTATIAPGFGIVSITLKDGKAISAVLDKEDAKQIQLRSPDGKKQMVQRAQVATITPPISVMPPMLGILTKPQIRDVVAYLAGLKAKTTKKK